MKLEADPTHPNPWLGTWIGGVLLAGLALAGIWIGLGLPLPACSLRTWVGIPCPTCGSTRMMGALLSGAPLKALQWNPLVFLGGVALLLSAGISLARRLTGRPPLRLVLRPFERAAFRWIAVLVLITSWIYQIVRDV